MTNLKLFTEPDVLQSIGARRLGKLLRPFAAELAAIHFPMPPPDEPSDATYFHTLAAVLANGSRIPQSLRKVLLTLEQAAAPESGARLDDAIQRRIPNVSLSRCLIVDRALEVWLVAPEELAPFAPSSNGGTTAGETHEATQLPPPATTGPSADEPANALGEAKTQTQNSKIDSSSELEAQRADPAPASSAPSEPQASFDRLARLSPVEYDQARKAEAKRLNLRLRTLDEAVEHARSFQDDAEADGLCLPQLEPWPDPITDAPALFDQIHERFLRYVYLPPGAAVVLTLWPGHAHAINAFTHTPRLNLTSAEPGCGKSTVFDILAKLCPNVLHTNNLKPAVLYRAMDRGQLTVLLDELDTYLHVHPELNGLLNASNKPGTYVHRCEGKSVRAFKIYAAIGLAGLGHLTPTLRHRSLVIHLTEAPAGVLKARFIPEQADTEKLLSQQLARWAKDNFNAIAACDPVMPASACNRLGDNWRPLFAIAQIIGGHWPERLLEAFKQLTSQSSVGSGLSGAAPSIRQLLEDVRDIFLKAGATQLFSIQIVAGLCALPGSRWIAANRGEPINQTWLGHQLSALGILSCNLSSGNRRAKGYKLCDVTSQLEAPPDPK